MFKWWCTQLIAGLTLSFTQVPDGIHLWSTSLFRDLVLFISPTNVSWHALLSLLSDIPCCVVFLHALHSGGTEYLYFSLHDALLENGALTSGCFQTLEQTEKRLVHFSSIEPWRLTPSWYLHVSSPLEVFRIPLAHPQSPNCDYLLGQWQVLLKLTKILTHRLLTLISCSISAFKQYQSPMFRFYHLWISGCILWFNLFQIPI